MYSTGEWSAATATDLFFQVRPLCRARIQGYFFVVSVERTLRVLALRVRSSPLFRLEPEVELDCVE
jgi:hypothetical protein